MADNFDEKSGLVFSDAQWGKWGQTIEDIHILIKVEKGTVAKTIKCFIEPKKIKVTVAQKTILEVHANIDLFLFALENSRWGFGSFI